MTNSLNLKSKFWPKWFPRPLSSHACTKVQEDRQIVRFSSGANKKFNRNCKYKLVKVLKIHYGIHRWYIIIIRWGGSVAQWLTGSVVTDEPQWATKAIEHIPFSARSLRPQPWLMSHQGKEPLKIYTFTCSFKTYSYMYLLYRHR